jgi:curved DNA-binding protein
VRLSGQGAPGIGGGPDGDLYLIVEVAPHPQFERDGDDLRSVVEVDAFTAAVGGEVRVPTIDGTVTLKIPPLTQADRVFRLRGKGMPRRDNPSERGDLFVRVKLVLPEPLSEDELATLRDLARRRRR